MQIYIYIYFFAEMLVVPFETCPMADKMMKTNVE